MATSTTKLGLRKPAGADLVNVNTDISANMDLIDGATGPKGRARYVSGNLALNSVSWASSGLGDIVLKAVVGDWVEISLCGLWSTEVNTGYLDVASIIAAAIVAGSGWGSPAIAVTNYGVAGAAGIASVVGHCNGTVMRQIVAGDLDVSSNVTCRVIFRTLGGIKTLYGTVDIPFVWSAKNLGQP